MEISKIKTPFVYLVEMYDPENKKWKQAEKRFYAVEQDVSNFPDNKMRRNFKKSK